MKYKKLFIPLILLSTISCNDSNIFTKDNILMTEFDTPFQTVPFDAIKTEDYKPAIIKAVKQAKSDVNIIVKKSEEPTFKNTVEALEQTTIRLSLLSNIFFNINLANTNEKIQKAAQEISVILTEFNNDINLNEDLFKKVKKVYDNKDKYKLTVEQQMLLYITYKDFIRNGANLNPEEKNKFRELTKELSQLTLKFGDNVLAETNNYELHIKNEEDMSGLPDYLIESAANKAASKEKEGWIITLDYPSYMPFLKYADNRGLREEIYKAYNSRGSHNNESNNLENIKRIVEIRLELAIMLGYNTYADYILEERMAESTDRVNSFLNDLLDASLPCAKKEHSEVQEFAKSMGADFQIQRWDWYYYSEKLKKHKFDINDEIIKPYFQLDNVKKGVFDLLSELYEISFRKNTEISVYHSEVEPYEVLDENGNLLAILYLDFFPRQSKQGGAWMTNYLEQYKIDGKDIRPHVSLVFNFTKPTETVPALLTYRELQTLLHEFGHGLHSIFSNCNYLSLSGTNVYGDFVELPSQIMENWSREKEWLDKIAVHYETGENIPDDIMDRIFESINFNTGYSCVRQLSFGLNDMAWHTIVEPYTGSIDELERKAMAPTNIFPELEDCLVSTAFSHIFSGGYAAGYYGYKWAEVLDADAFSLFKANGIYNKETANSFRENILAKGGTEKPMELYKKFRGHEPSIEPLLERSGLKSELN